MNKDHKTQVSFIPCGDSLEKMEEIREEELEQVSGGAGIKRDGVCCVCGCNSYNRMIDGKNYLVCSVCGNKE